MTSRKMEKAEQLAELLKLLAHPLRLMIICLLNDKEMYAQELLEALGTTKGNISQHIKLLLMKNIIKKRHEANRIYYSVKDENVHQLIKQMEKIYCHS